MNIYAILGRHDLENDYEVGSIEVDISEIKIHPEWNPFEVSFHADVAVLELAMEVSFTEYIQPICLPEPNTNVFDVEGVVAGYGLTENSNTHVNLPKFIEISSISHRECLFKEPNLVQIGSPNLFCAGEKGKNPCQGNRDKKN